MSGREIRKLLISKGFEVYSARKITRTVGGDRYMSARGDMVYSTGTPESHYEVHLWGGATVREEETAAEHRPRARKETVDNYLAVVDTLIEAGYRNAEYNDQLGRVVIDEPLG